MNSQVVALGKDIKNCCQNFIEMIMESKAYYQNQNFLNSDIDRFRKYLSVFKSSTTKCFYKLETSSLFLIKRSMNYNAQALNKMENQLKTFGNLLSNNLRDVTFYQSECISNIILYAKEYYLLKDDLEKNQINKITLINAINEMNHFENGINNYFKNQRFSDFINYCQLLIEYLFEKKVINDTSLEYFQEKLNDIMSENKKRKARNNNKVFESNKYGGGMEIEDEKEEESSHITYASQQQIIQLNPQLLKQLQDQSYSNDCMLRLLVAAENYAYADIPYDSNLEKCRKYAFYDAFNSMQSKDKQEKKKELLYQIRNFTYSFDIYMDDHGTYHFPSNLDKYQILRDIENWKRKYIEGEDAIYYDYIKLILEGKFNIDSLEQINEELKDIKGRTAVRDEKLAQRKMETIPKIVYHVDMKGEKLKEKYIKEGNFQIKANLYQKPGSDKYLSKVNGNFLKVSDGNNNNFLDVILDYK